MCGVAGVEGGVKGAVSTDRERSEVEEPLPQTMDADRIIGV